MSRKSEKNSSSFSRPLKKIYRRISTARPSALLLSVVVISLAILLFGGGLYNVVQQPLPSAYSGGRFHFLHPRLSEQFISGSIIATTLYSLGVIGILAIYKSTEYTYKPKQAYMIFLVGVVLLFIAYTFLEVILQMKTGG